MAVLAAETSLACPEELVSQLAKLGVRSLGELAQLPLRQVTARFGEAGRRCHAVASAAPDRRVAPELARPDLAVEMVFEEPLERVDAAAFAARQLAARLHGVLKEAGQVCLRLRVVAEFVGGERLERIWRTQEALSENATADRVRWQLDGWLSSARASDGGGVSKLALEPVEVAAPASTGLWGHAKSDEQAKRVIARVQSQLGVDRVLQPRRQAGAEWPSASRMFPTVSSAIPRRRVVGRGGFLAAASEPGASGCTHSAYRRLLPRRLRYRRSAAELRSRGTGLGAKTLSGDWLGRALAGRYVVVGRERTKNRPAPSGGAGR